ncbi:MAG: hypothetical protein U1C66_00680 [Patescibacteria group bacterium]|nr:hypothetical protein [Patescibacteria group bacterium]
MMFLTYQRETLRAHVNTWIGSAFLATVALWAGLTIWHAATGESALVQAFAKVIEQRTVLGE